MTSGELSLETHRLALLPGRECESFCRSITARPGMSRGRLACRPHPRRVGSRPVVRHRSKSVAIDATNHRIVRIAQPSRILGNHIQHRLNVRRRAGDDTQNFARRSLLLQRLLEFLEQPDVLDGDHRLVGEGFEQLDLRRGEGAHLGATRGQVSNEFPLLTKGNDQEGTPAAGGHPTLGNRSARADVGNVKRAVLAHPAKLWLINTDLGAGNGYGTKMSPRNHRVPLVESQYHVINPTNPRGALDDGVEHRLHVRRRAADDAEHLGGRRLMLQGLAQFCVALLQFLEQPDILDGDDRLVGEGLEQCDLLVSKRTDLRSTNKDHPDRQRPRELKARQVWCDHPYALWRGPPLETPLQQRPSQSSMWINSRSMTARPPTESTRQRLRRPKPG